MAGAKKKWRVDTWFEGVDAKRVAAKLESRLNAYEKDGYDIYDVSIDQGILIARGREEEEAPDDYQTFMRTALNNIQQMGSPSPPPGAIKVDGHHTATLLNQVFAMVQNSGVFALSTGTPEARVDEIIRQTFIEPNEVRMSLADIERARSAHKDCSPSCVVDKIYEMSLAGLHRYIRSNPLS